MDGYNVFISSLLRIWIVTAGQSEDTVQRHLSGIKLKLESWRAGKHRRTWHPCSSRIKMSLYCECPKGGWSVPPPQPAALQNVSIQGWVIGAERVRLSLSPLHLMMMMWGVYFSHPEWLLPVQLKCPNVLKWHTVETCCCLLRCRGKRCWEQWDFWWGILSRDVYQIQFCWFPNLGICNSKTQYQLIHKYGNENSRIIGM